MKKGSRFLLLLVILFALSSVFAACGVFFGGVDDGTGSRTTPDNKNEPAEVTSVQISCATAFKVTEFLELSAAVSPQNAADKAVQFVIVENGTTAEGAYIDNGYLYAGGLGVVKIKAFAVSNGIESPIFSIQVLKEPVTAVNITNGGNYDVEYEPVTELFSTSDFADTGWELAPAGYAVYDSETGNTGSRSICMFPYTWWEQTEHFPSVSKKIVIPGGKAKALNLSFYMTRKNPDVANISGYLIRYSTNGTTWIDATNRVAINGGWKKYSVSVDLNGADCNEFYIAIIGVRTGGTAALADALYVDDISYTVSGSAPSFIAGSSLTLTGQAIPLNATYKDVTYEIDFLNTTAAGAAVDGNVLTATGTGDIKVYPIADGFYGNPVLIKVL